MESTIIPTKTERFIAICIDGEWTVYDRDEDAPMMHMDCPDNEFWAREIAKSLSAIDYTEQPEEETDESGESPAGEKA